MTSHVDPALLQMFAAEVETHMAALNDGVLALEQNPNQSECFEALMRAAHSIKGAAKLVGLQAAVEVAHVIEDCFVAAREGRLAMTSRLVDVLLEGVDFLGRAAQFDAPPDQRVTAPQIAAIVQLISQASTAAIDGAETAPLPDAESPLPDVSAELRPVACLDASWVRAVHLDFATRLKRQQTLDLDLSNVTAIEPLGLALLTLAARSPDPKRCPLRLRNVPPSFIPLLEAVGLAKSLRSSETGG